MEKKQYAKQTALYLSENERGRLRRTATTKNMSVSALVGEAIRMGALDAIPSKEMPLNNLKKIRKAYGFTQLDLSRLSGVSLHTIRDIEQGRATARQSTLKRLAAAFGLLPEVFTAELPE